MLSDRHVPPAGTSRLAVLHLYLHEDACKSMHLTLGAAQKQSSINQKEYIMKSRFVLLNC